MSGWWFEVGGRNGTEGEAVLVSSVLTEAESLRGFLCQTSTSGMAGGIFGGQVGGLLGARGIYSGPGGYIGSKGDKFGAKSEHYWGPGGYIVSQGDILGARGIS